MGGIRYLKTVVGAIAAATCMTVLSGQMAQAGTMHGGWNYAIDSFNDGSTGGVIGANSDFEFYGMAVQEDAENMYVAINSNLGLEGWSSGSKHVGYGDLFFNFSGKDFKTASNEGLLLGVHFAEASDSDLELGVYGGVTAKSVAQYNWGFKNLTRHRNTVGRKQDQDGNNGVATLGDLEQTDSYFQQTGKWTIPTSIDTYQQRLGDVQLVSNLSGLGLDFGHFDAVGEYTFGFSFSKATIANAGYSGDYIASLFAECGNDGLALNGHVKDVPEPASMAGLALLGLTFMGGKLRRRFAS